MNPDFEPATIAGVLALTIFVVSAIKVSLGDAPLIRKVPLIVISMGVAIGITALAHWADMLQGSFAKLMCQSILAALGSGGAYGVWSGSATQSLGLTKNMPSTTGQNSVPIDSNLSESLYAITGYRPPADGTKFPQLGLILAGLIVFVGGCAMLQQIKQSTPTGRVYQAKSEFKLLLATLADLRDAGVIKQSTLDGVRSFEVVARIALDEWEQQAIAGTSTSDSEAKYAEAVKILQKLKDTSVRASTQPTTRSVSYDTGNAFRLLGQGSRTRRYATA